MTMLNAIAHTWQQPTSLGRCRRASAVEWGWVLAINLIAAGLAGMLVLRGATPAIIAWLLVLAGIVVILLEPRHGIYMAIPLALAGDGVDMTDNRIDTARAVTMYREVVANAVPPSTALARRRSRVL